MQHAMIHGAVDIGATFSNLIPSNRDFRVSIVKLAEMMKAGGSFNGHPLMPVDGIETLHHYIPGVYIREVRIPKGMIIIGRIHTTEHQCIVVGDVEISCEESHRRYIGYNTFHSRPGVQRALYTFEDTVFSTVHRTDETDPEKMLDQLSVETWEAFERLQSGLEVLP